VPTDSPTDSTVPLPGGARQSSLRTANLGLVLRTICAAPAPISRADLSSTTGISRATASRLVDELVSGGLVDELERSTSPRRGRPSTPLAPGSCVAALGLQVDAGLLAARVLDLRGAVVAERIEDGDFVASDPAVVLPRLVALTSALLADLPRGIRLVGAGLALPGIVDAGTGVLLRAPNLGWTDLRPAGFLDGALPGALAPVLGNEADLAARTVAEAAPGRAGTHRDFLYLSGQIGIGGAAVLGGAVVAGRSGWAGEMGHVCVDPDGPACRCGSTGCLEQYAGRQALFTAAGLPAAASPAELAERVRAGDAAAHRALETATWALGVALAGVVNVLDIPTVVLGGHLAGLVDLLRPDLERRLAGRVLSARWRRPTVHAAEDNLAPGATGAALRALEGVLNDPATWLR
jgi:predicted NBD/HSP70 family sugar kinase